LRDEKNNPKCPQCRGKSQKRGRRRGKVRFQCNDCGKWFQINRGKKIDSKLLTRLHLEGLSFRSLAEQFNISVGSAYNYVQDELKKLPHCADVTRDYCQKFSGILEVDGKYLKVKTYQRKIPVIYGVDYTTHDIPHFILSKAENYQTGKKFFSSLNLMGYPLQAVVSDDNPNLYETAKYAFPRVTTQLCHLHYLRNIRYSLDLNENLQHREFIRDLRHLHYLRNIRYSLDLNENLQHREFIRDLRTLFFTKRAPDDFDNRARNLLQKFQNDRTCVETLINIAKRKEHLLGYLSRRGTPLTTNLIEGFNSHLQARLSKINGFETMSHAKTWLNAYFLRRRTKKFTDCRGKFTYLNGKTSLQMSKKPGIKPPTFF